VNILACYRLKAVLDADYSVLVVLMMTCCRSHYDRRDGRSSEIPNYTNKRRLACIEDAASNQSLVRGNSLDSSTENVIKLAT